MTIGGNMAEVKDFKCPSCGSSVTFDSDSQHMKCSHCGTEIEMDAFKEYNEALEKISNVDQSIEWETSGEQWTEADNMRTYRCQSCGGEIVTGQDAVATSCPYCDNPVVLIGNVSGDLKPDWVIPFKKDMGQAKEALKKHYKGKWLLPANFQEENRLDEIKGVYVPFWLFNCETDAMINYRCTKVATWSDSEYNYTKTSYFLVLRGGHVGFVDVPVDGSSKMPDDIMESIEPFNMEESTTFNPGFLSGYMADKYDVTKEDSIDRANQRIKNSTYAIFKDTVRGYATVRTEESSIQLAEGKVSYALMPVWMISTKHEEKQYLFAMNGQSGKLIGDLPVDRKKASVFFAACWLVFSVVLYFILSAVLR